MKRVINHRARWMRRIASVVFVASGIALLVADSAPDECGTGLDFDRTFDLLRECNGRTESGRVRVQAKHQYDFDGAITARHETVSGADLVARAEVKGDCV